MNEYARELGNKVTILINEYNKKLDPGELISILLNITASISFQLSNNTLEITEILKSTLDFMQVEWEATYNTKKE